MNGISAGTGNGGSIIIYFYIGEQPRNQQHEYATPVGFTTIERAPMYPNGAAGINEHLRKNLKYPPEAFKKRLQGEAIVDFVIGLDGKVEEARVVKSVHPLLDQEAVRMIEALDRWIPARQGGKPVKMRIQKAIRFNRKA